MTQKRLRALLGTYPHTAPIKNGSLASDRIVFDFEEIQPVWDGFTHMVREQRYDVSEMAIVTYLLALAHGKPMALLPAAMVGRFQHAFAIYNPAKGALRPQDLNGKRVGVRSITTTTGTWVRGILAGDYGVDLASIHWVTSEDPHVPEVIDRNERAPRGKSLVQMLLDGEIDALLGENSTDPRLRPLFEDPQAEAQRWYGRRKLVPVNHFVVVRQALLESEPETVREVYRLLSEGKRQAGAPANAPDPIPFGIEANRPALELIAGTSFDLGLVPRRITVDEMFAPVRSLIA